MSDDHSKQATKCFYLGNDSDDSESEDDEPTNQRRFSISSGCSDDIVGGTNLNFDDEDSGLGMSIGDRDSNGSDDSQLLPLRPVNIGKYATKPKPEHKQQRTRRGKHFHDFYEMKNDHLGTGAYATVRTCVSRATGEEFAVKVVNKHENGHTRSRILREVEIFKICRDHPNIVQLQEWFEDEDCYYMVFEKMQGGPLLSQIQNKVCFNEQEAAQVTKNIANALKFLHDRHIAHRDLKPENVLCCSNSSVAPVKLCDLDLASKPSMHGIRRASRQLQNVQSEPDLSSPVGSAEFLAPEVVETFLGAEALKYNRQCDLWSLGVIIFVMLSGYTPFYGECKNADSCGWNQGQFCEDCQENLFEKIREGSFDFPAEEWDSISEEAKDLISHLLVKDSRKRYTAVQVLQHPWIINAPETPLNTATNLCRNSSIKDVQQYNDHFNMNVFANRLSSRVEETILSCGSTPENESLLQEAYETSSQYTQDVVNKASKLLEKSFREDKLPMVNERPEQIPPVYVTEHNNVEMQPLVYYPPQMMNGVYYGPQMVPNLGYIPQPVYYSQDQYYVASDYPFNHVNAPHYNQAYVPPTFYNQSTKLETVVEESPRNPQFDHMDRVNSALRPLTPAGDQLDKKHRGSLSAAISQLGLETCQNAMVRQGSGKEIYHPTREAEVNV